MNSNSQNNSSIDCPYCEFTFSSPPKRKKKCPNCGEFIFIRDGNLVTKDQSMIIDWLAKLEYYGVSRNVFEKERKQLSDEFGFKASVNDTMWRILNLLVTKHTNNPHNLKQIYQLMSSLASSEGKDPTPYLEQAASIRKTIPQPEPPDEKDLFLGHDELAHVRKLRKKGKFDDAEELLYRAEPSPAVLDELRKTKSVQARKAKDNDDWEAVIDYLESYIDYAEKYRDYCIQMVNQAPPEHTQRDINLLNKAKRKIGQ